jgi:hypothetical protein
LAPGQWANKTAVSRQSESPKATTALLVTNTAHNTQRMLILLKSQNLLIAQIAVCPLAKIRQTLQ